MSRQRRRRRRNKRRKLSKKEDYFSRLPDSIIIDEILSRLPTKDAVKTGVLSTRWKHLWTCNPNLSFGLFGIRDDQGYASFVNKTLSLHSSDKVRKFSLCCFHDIFDGKWLRFAISHYVEYLTLELINRTRRFPYNKDCIRYKIPQDLYAHSSLTKLRTNFCDHAPKAEVSWTSLKVLYIGEASLTEDTLQRILAGTPLLERLELRECWGVDSIQVSSTSALKELVITEWLDQRRRHALNTLEISIPGVKSLELYGNWETKCLLLDAPSLVEAHLNEFSLDKKGDVQEYAAMVKEMLLRVTFVSKLSVGPMFLRTKSACNSIFLNSASTNLEELYIYLFHDEDGFDEGNLIEEEDYWSSLEHLQFMKLKVIWISPFGLRKYNDCYDYLLGFAQFMLKKATMLEKMIIICPCLYGLDPKFLELLYDEMARELLTLHRCSPKAEIMIRRPKVD
ncbi:hypothetical protein COLO4_31580 [Corchorus olitorius]|uniref:Uncharacterized protein n=1 Tax=Corchorus olitorius TaxID=93759 RepID=A0A1R3H448_9ROSI|nr:hypothetical protein COLO4_31580 [Corchorus olitorius]